MWVKQKRKKYRKNVLYVIEKALSCSMFFSMIAQWKFKIQIIQRMLKSAMFFKVSLYDSLLFRWNQTEYVGSQGGGRIGKKRSNISLRGMRERTVNEGVSSIPVDIKLYYIRKSIKEMMKIYIHEFRSYKAEFNAVHRQNLQNKWKLDISEMIKYPIPPIKPDISQYFTTEKFTFLIQQALQERLEWAKILEGLNPKNNN